MSIKSIFPSPSTMCAMPPTATLELHEKECLIHLGGNWQLNAPFPSWEATLQQTRASHIKITAKDLGTWDTALLLFLMHGRAWCLAKKIPLEISSLPLRVQSILKHAEAAPHPKALRKHAHRYDFLFYLGNKILALFVGMKEAAAFLGNCTLAIFQIMHRNQKFRWRDCFVEMQQCWSSSLLIVSFISFLVGVILSFQAAILLQRYGAGILVVDLVSISIVREMGPMMAAIIVAGGIGAGFAAQLGNMKVDEEIDALETLGISTMNFLVLPRLLAVSIMMPILTIYSNVLGILGGMYICVTTLHIPAAVYWNEMQNRVHFTDISSGIIKSFVFGIIIALVGCWRGIHCDGNTAGVGRATSSAVVTSIMLIILTDAVFSVIYNELRI